MSALHHHVRPGALVLLTALSLLLGGCAATGDTADSNPLALLVSSDDSDLSPEERQIREDARVFERTVLGGAVTVGGIAGLLCLLEKGTDELEECAGHAVVGGIAGAVDGYLTAKKQEAARKQVREIDLITQDIEERNAGIRKLVESSQKVVEQSRERINDVKLKIAQNEVREERLEEEKARLQENIDVMNGTIKNLMQEKRGYEAIARKLAEDGREVASLNAKVGRMSMQIAALEEQRDALEEINQAARIG